VGSGLLVTTNQEKGRKEATAPSCEKKGTVGEGSEINFQRSSPKPITSSKAFARLKRKGRKRATRKKKKKIIITERGTHLQVIPRTGPFHPAGGALEEFGKGRDTPTIPPKRFSSAVRKKIAKGSNTR